ncbi:MAG: response regulator [Pseudomonadota bacterium]
MDDLEDFVMRRMPTANRPLLGMTILVVEDSRYACEALRLLCLRSGARIRRADSLRTARKHLMVYSPSVVIVDLGLPDGSGADLIRQLADQTPRVPVILGISGDDGGAAITMDAGANGFLAKPVGALAEFQEAVLAHVPREVRPAGPRPVTSEEIAPDDLALRDDLTHAAELLSGPGERPLGYVAQFVSGLARSAKDNKLFDAADSLGTVYAKGDDSAPEAAELAAVIQDRLAASDTL